MARWDPDAEQRLRQAALELFREHGFDAVTVTQIAERAGLTRRSFFRYFPDKREVLFDGSDRLAPAFGEAIGAVRASAGLAEAMLTAVAEVGALLIGEIDHPAERRAVIAASDQLLERERTKIAQVTAAISDALRERGAAPATARLLARVGTVAFQEAFDRWLESGGRVGFAEALGEAAEAVGAVVDVVREKAP